MKTKFYNVIYEARGEIISTAVFHAVNIKEARNFANFHKRMTPEINRAGRVKTTVNLKK